MSNVRIEPGTEGGMARVFVDDVEMQGITKYKLSQGQGEPATLELEAPADIANAIGEQVGITVTTKETGKPDKPGKGRE